MGSRNIDIEGITVHIPESPEPSYKITPEGQRRIDGRGFYDLLNNSIKVLDRDGTGGLSRGVLDRDSYPSGDHLRLGYWCDAAGNGKIEVGLQGLQNDGKGYEEVLVFDFNLRAYKPEEWNEGLLKRVRSAAMIRHYIPGSWEEDLAERAGKA